MDWTSSSHTTKLPAVEAQVENETQTNKQERERYQKPNTESCGKWSNKNPRGELFVNVDLGMRQTSSQDLFCASASARKGEGFRTEIYTS